jgi:serine/threonine protein kinase
MYGFIRKSKARRSYEYALKLLEAGIETPQPVAYLELKRYGLLEESYYISLQCPYSRLFREFADGSSIKGREDIIEAFGLMAARLHEAGILHKDLSIGNILFEKEATGIHLALVDLNRMRFGPISWRKGIKNLARLRGEPAFFEVLVRSYAAARGVDPERSLVWLLKDQQRSVRRFKRKARWKRLFLERSGRQVTS